MHELIREDYENNSERQVAGAQPEPLKEDAQEH